ncbi:unnamed protein product [Notodromas monacha]|uniref:Uncharacterized protein n=1 Tax=Notodromas monacha TaxID=399045 RepID=A0A7R9GCU0_9CRUS|nr:unnamed protein product [Notodromas monacha]CAG0916202.1 unnamed protein product [Notodromas monacha]
MALTIRAGAKSSAKRKRHVRSKIFVGGTGFPSPGDSAGLAANSADSHDEKTASASQQQQQKPIHISSRDLRIE